MTKHEPSSKIWYRKAPKLPRLLVSVKPTLDPFGSRQTFKRICLPCYPGHRGISLNTMSSIITTICWFTTGANNSTYPTVIVCLILRLGIILSPPLVLTLLEAPNLGFQPGFITICSTYFERPLWHFDCQSISLAHRVTSWYWWCCVQWRNGFITFSQLSFWWNFFLEQYWIWCTWNCSWGHTVFTSSQGGQRLLQIIPSCWENIQQT